MKIKKEMALVLALAALTGGCAKQADDGKITLKVGNWPDETNAESLTKQNELKDKFTEANPDINIVPDTYTFDTKTFTMKASADQLPNLYSTWFTEIDNIIKQGYAADITEQMKKHGFDTAINSELLNLVKDENGKIYGVPTDAYAQGLYIDKKLFKEAGLVTADGSIKVPNTYEELAEYAGIIKWSYGVEFVKQKDDGSYEAAFDTQEARDALQYVKDLKWKYNALHDETVIDQNEMNKLFGTYQAAMMFANPPSSALSAQYGMDKEDIYVARMPQGPKGRFSQMGGNLRMFSKNSTPEQIDAGLTWLEFTGFSPDITDEQLENSRTSYENTISQNGIVLDREAFEVWVNPENVKKINGLREEYANVKHDDYADYFSFKDVTINPEPSACAQQLYAILDKCIQEVITNKDADVDKLISEACKDYQLNHLNKM